MSSHEQPNREQLELENVIETIEYHPGMYDQEENLIQQPSEARDYRKILYDLEFFILEICSFKFCWLLDQRKYKIFVCIYFEFNSKFL